MLEFTRSYQVTGDGLGDSFYNNSDGSPSEGEVLLVALLICETSCAFMDRNDVLSWASAMVKLSGGNYFDDGCNWVPCDEYNTGRYSKNPVYASGLAYLTCANAERRKGIHLAMAHEDHVVTFPETRYYLDRLKLPPRGKKSLRPTLTKRYVRSKYVLTGAAYFLQHDSNVKAMVHLLDLAHGQVRSGEKQVSATKGEYKRRSHELGKEIAELKLGAMDLEAEFEKRCISVSDTYKHNYHTQVHQRLNFP